MDGGCKFSRAVSRLDATLHKSWVYYLAEWWLSKAKCIVKRFSTIKSKKLKKPKSVALIFSFSLFLYRTSQYILWKPWYPTQSSAKWWRPFRRGRPSAVQLCSWLRLRRPRHAHLHYQCWKHRRVGLSCSHLSRYGWPSLYVYVHDCI